MPPKDYPKAKKAKKKPRRTTKKKEDRPKVTKTVKTVQQDKTPSWDRGGRGIKTGVVTPKIEPKLKPVTPSRGIVDIGFGAGQVDPRLAAGVGTMALPSTVGTTGLVQGAPWVSTSGWKPDIGGLQPDDEKKTKKEKKIEEEKKNNEYAICTDSIAKTAGTSKRSEWSEDAKDRYEKCLKDINSEKHK